MLRKLMITIAAGGLLIAGLVQFSAAAMVPAKAWLSVKLINQAWSRTLDGETGVRPWPWMDSTPVARLGVPRLGKSQVVLKGTSGAVLAFAPGWHERTAFPGKPGISLLSAHRDTHFGFLRDLKKGDEITLQTADGLVRYEVEGVSIVQTPEIKVPAEENERVLLLSTCYPFTNWQAGDVMRFVVVAREKAVPGAGPKGGQV